MFKRLGSRSIWTSFRSSCSSSSTLPISKNFFEWKEQKRNSRWRWTGPLLGFSVITTVKDVFGYKPFSTDHQEIEQKVKEGWLARKARRYSEAVKLFKEALEMTTAENNPLFISRIYNELANTYYQMGELDEAEELFRIIIHRLLELHGKHESDAAFIEVSLKLSDIFAQKGDLDAAEAGYHHCVTRQMKVLEEHLRKYLVSHGAKVSGEHPVEIHGEIYTDPLALFGMCLEQYALFLVKYRDSSRLEESQECFNETLKVSNQIFGSTSFHLANLLNNYGAALISSHHYELAKKYLSLGIDKILQISECVSMIPGYYCNFAEALFHCGQVDEALDYARRAVKLAEHSDEKTQRYVHNFLHDIEIDAKKAGKK